MRVSLLLGRHITRLCKQSGIDVLIWDWYWYDGKPCLHEALENGFLEASNTKDVKFACMWTNHPWYVLYPTKRTDGSNAYPPSFDAPDFSKEECWKKPFLYDFTLLPFGELLEN